MDWAALQQVAHGASPEAVKAALPIPYVLEAAGHVIYPEGGQYQAVCPFHDDAEPSLDIYGESLERWGCFPCSAGGDVLDLVKRLHHTESFNATMHKAEELLAAMKEAGWSGPTVGTRREFDWDAAAAAVTAARQVDPAGPVDRFLEAKGERNPALAQVSAEWLVSTFGLGAQGESILIPYFDRAGQLVTYKHRTAASPAKSAPGSSFGNVLYAEWRDTDPALPVVLCEGESDVWAATWAMAGTCVVLGLPTGAGAHPKQAVQLAGRTVVLALDGDKAGRIALLKWYHALLEEGCEVTVAPVPDGYDLAGLTQAGIRDVIGRAQAVPKAPDGILSGTTGYYRPGKEVHTDLSNWIFHPDRKLSGSSGSAYEGRLMPGGQEVVLTSQDLSTKARLVGWASRNERSWYGSDRDGQIILGMLQAEAPFLASGRLTTLAGLEGVQFIWPGGRIGSDYLVYVPPTADTHLERRIDIAPRPWDVVQVPILRSLHQRRVMDPMLAWLAVAPLRSMLREFPILAVTGSSGTGKTTLLETVVPAFTGTLISSNLTSTTPHSIFSFVGSTNAFPVWFDEYRPGARKDTLHHVNQILRDAYTAQASSKGGMGEQWAEVTTLAAAAPIIVSGEDAFSETSHLERMVLLTLPLEGRDPEALTRVKAWEGSGLAHAYLAWLHRGLVDGTLPAIVNASSGPEDLGFRPRLNIGVLELGWALLNAFVRAHNPGLDLGEPDLSLVIEQARRAAESSPIRDALMWALDEDDATVFCGRREDKVYVRVENFVQYVERHTQYVLPGSQKAVSQFFVDHYGAVDEEVAIFGTKKRALVFHGDRL